MEKLFELDYKLIDDSDLCKIDNPILRILKRYSYDIGDYENDALTEAVFNRLGWGNQYKDTIFSFFRTLCLLAECYSRNNMLFLDDGAVVRFRYENNSLKYEINEVKSRKYQYSKKVLYNKATGENQILKKLLQLVENDIEKDVYNDLKIIAELSDSLANFIPHPGYPFNQAKGLLNDVGDSLNLMIDKIQDSIDKEAGLIYGNKMVECEKLIRWQKWFIKNRSEYCLEDVYEITSDNRIKGTIMFFNQTLSNPFPQSIEEMKQYQKNIVELLQKRSRRMNKLFR